MKNIVKFVVVFCIALMFVGCIQPSTASSAELDGKWEVEYNLDTTPFGSEKSYNNTLEFSGKNFTAVDHFAVYYLDANTGRGRASIGVFPFTFKVNSEKYSVGNDASFTLVEEGFNNNKLEGYVYLAETKGTFTVTDNEIEFVLEDGSIVVCQFSRTENTIRIIGGLTTWRGSRTNRDLRFTRVR